MKWVYGFGLVLLAAAAVSCFYSASALTAANTHGIPPLFLIQTAQPFAKALMVVSAVGVVAAAFATMVALPEAANAPAPRRTVEVGLVATAVAMVVIGALGGLYGELFARHLSDLNGGDSSIGSIARVPALLGGGIAAVAGVTALGGAAILRLLRQRPRPA